MRGDLVYTLLPLFACGVYMFKTIFARFKKKQPAYPIPLTYAKAHRQLTKAFEINIGGVTQSAPVYYKLLKMRELFTSYRNLFDIPEHGPSMTVVKHGFSEVTMTIKLRTLNHNKLEFKTATYEFSGNQLVLVMRSLRPLLTRMGVD